MYIKEKILFFAILSIQSNALFALPNWQEFTFQKDENKPLVVSVNQLSQFQIDHLFNQKMNLRLTNASDQQERKNEFLKTIELALMKHPDIQQQIQNIQGQNANIEIVKAGYYPHLSSAMTTGDFSSRERGKQLVSLSATQLLYDFGKTQSSINAEQAQLAVKKVNLLIKIDEIALKASSLIINIKRSQEIVRIAQQEVKGIRHIVDITQLRSKAGLSSQADPVQAQSYLQIAQTNLIAQQSLLKQYQLQLQTLVGLEQSLANWEIPTALTLNSALYDEPKFNRIPQMMASQAEIYVAQAKRSQAKAEYYPTVSLKGTLSQAFNGRNPNTNEQNGHDSSIMLEATANLFQGGATAAQVRAASYAEDAAKSKLSSDYRNILDQIQLIREQIENKQRQLQILLARQQVTIKTKELYQEQYKLGTRSALDLLNAEQAIHSASSDIENARYDIYNSLAQYIQVTGRTRDVYELNHVSIQGVEIQP
ncbi:TolC family protein [Acinetobacter sp. ANC 5502]